MPRYIDADALLSNRRRGLSIRDATKHSDDIKQRNQAFDTMMLYEVRDMIEDAPTVDAAPVVRGEWRGAYEFNVDVGKELMCGYECGVCLQGCSCKTLFCPNCGAKMEGV